MKEVGTVISLEFTNWIKNKMEEKYNLTIDKPDKVIDCRVLDDIDKPGLFEWIEFEFKGRTFLARNQHNDDYVSIIEKKGENTDE